MKYVIYVDCCGTDVGDEKLISAWHTAAKEHLKNSEIPYIIVKSYYHMSNVLYQKDRIMKQGVYSLPIPGDCEYFADSILTFQLNSYKLIPGMLPILSTRWLETLKNMLDKNCW